MGSFDKLKNKSRRAGPKKFLLELIKFPKLKQVTLPERRYYEDADGRQYESATTWLGRMTDHSAIDDWVKRVGQAEADRICKAATDRGTSVHELIEDYLLGREPKKQPSLPRAMFRAVTPLLNNIDHIKGIECQLHSRKMKIAGTADCIGFYKGKLSVIDFKTSTRAKKREWIESYFLQGTLYALMYWELTGIWIEQIVILIAVEDSYSKQEFIVRTDDHLNTIRRYLEK